MDLKQHKDIFSYEEASRITIFDKYTTQLSFEQWIKVSEYIVSEAKRHFPNLVDVADFAVVLHYLEIIIC
ncbi:hypothetical protein MASR2M29_23470 [Spirochaetota bacterium]